jgi:hypothetical protein
MNEKTLYDTSSDELLEAGHEEIIMAELKEKLMALKDKLSQMDELIEDVKCSLYT